MATIHKTFGGGTIFQTFVNDTKAKEIVASTLEKLGVEAVILPEQADEGKIVIVKIESYTGSISNRIGVEIIQWSLSLKNPPVAIRIEQRGSLSAVGRALRTTYAG